MALFCSKVTHWIKRKVLQPVEKFIKVVESRCKKQPWWSPIRWYCWLSVRFIRIVLWVVREIVVPVIGLVCNVVTASKASVRLIRIAGSSTPGQNEYLYELHCPDGSTAQVWITATTETDAENEAIAIYAVKC